MRLAGVTPGGYTLPNSAAALAMPRTLSRLGSCAMHLFPMIPDDGKCAAFSQGRVQLAIVTQVMSTGLGEAVARQHATFRIVTVESLSQAPAAPLPAPVARPQQPLFLATRSGTTGQPKPLLLTQQNVASAMLASMDLAHYGPWRDKADYRCIGAFPLSTTGSTVLLGCASSPWPIAGRWMPWPPRPPTWKPCFPFRQPQVRHCPACAASPPVWTFFLPPLWPA